MVETLPSRAEGAGLVPAQGAKILNASQPKNKHKKKKRNNTVTNSIKTLKMVHIKKNLKKTHKTQQS